MGTPNPGQYQPYQQSQPPPPPAQQYAPPGAYQGGYGAPQGYPPPGDPPGTYMGHPLAHWFSRVGAYLIDGAIIGVPASIVMIVATLVLSETDPFTGTRVPTAAGSLLTLGVYLIVLGVSLYNYVFLQGRTGQTWGKRILGIRLVRMSDGQPLGPAMAFVRGLAHIADSPFFIGYLWPLWDAHRQTFADKICSSLVLASQTSR